MKKALKVMWRLLPWYLAIRGMYIYMGMMLDRVRYKSDTNSMWVFAGKEDMDSMVARINEANCLCESRARSGWKWCFGKD